MSLFEQHLTDPAEAALRVRIKLSSYDDLYHKGASKSNSAIVQYYLKRMVTYDAIENLDAKMRNLRRESRAPAKFRRKLWMKTLISESVCDEKSLNSLFVERATHLIAKIERHCEAEHQYATLKDLAQIAESLLH